MKKTFVVFLVIGFILSGVAFGQRATAKATIGGKNVEIEYGTPSLQGRDMLSRLPVGQTWRMGMNAATMLKSDATLVFGGSKVAPGEYRLTAKRVSESDWHLVINHDDGNIEVPLQTKEASSSVETFEITLSSSGGNAGSFSMAWGMLHVGADFKVE